MLHCLNATAVGHTQIDVTMHRVQLGLTWACAPPPPPPPTAFSPAAILVSYCFLGPGPGRAARHVEHVVPSY